MKKTIDLDKYKKMYHTFVKHRSTVILSMLDDDGHPFTSCAPFVQKDGKLYIFISEVAEHYRFIEKSTYIDALLIADEDTTKNNFATERVRWKCTALNIGIEEQDDIFDLFYKSHGKSLIDMLRGLDFSLFELTPRQGRYVIGFGMAFDLDDYEGNGFTHVIINKEEKE